MVKYLTHLNIQVIIILENDDYVNDYHNLYYDNLIYHHH